MRNKEHQNSIYFTSSTLFLSLILLSSTASADPMQTALPAAICAYIPIQDGTVSILDTTNNTILATVNLSSNPIYPESQTGVAVSPDGSKLYIAKCGNNAIYVMNTTTNTITSTLHVYGPIKVAINPMGTKVYVTSYSNNVSVIDTATNTLTATVPVGTYPSGIAVTPDGTKVYVTNCDRDYISVIDTSNNTVTATVNVGLYPSGIAVTPDGTKVYVTNTGSNNVSVIDTATNTIKATVDIDFPEEVAVSPDGTKVYVTSSARFYEWNGYIVSEINTATNTVTATINVGNHAQGVAFNPSGTKVFVTNPDSGMVSIIDTATNKLIATMNLGNNPLVSGQFIVPSSALKPVPYVNFSSNVTCGYAPLTVQFTDVSKNATGWYWDFGDGTTSTEQNPTHTYSSAGPYTVKLIANNQNYTDSKFEVITVLDYNLTPVANFVANPTKGGNPLFVQFTDLSQNAAGWYWDFGDGATSTLRNPGHIYIDKSSGSGPGVMNVQISYTVTLTLSNENVTSSKKDTIYMDRQFFVGPGYSDSSSGGGGGGGSPEPSTNVEVKELSQAMVTSGNTAKFDFPKNATSVVYVSLDSKKNIGRTTTTVEMLTNKSSLTTEIANGDVYKYLNIWVGNSGFGTSKNIENSLVYFKVKKSWINDKNIDQSSVSLNMYSDKKWDQLPTSFSGEDDQYLYFTAQTPGFSSFAITGKMKATGETQLSTENKTQSAVSSSQSKSTNGSMATNVEQIPDKKQSTNNSGKESTKTPGFEIVSGIVSLLCVFLYKRR